ncbi:UDP-Glc:alpha-D-GlcNAc-diphosphoundecaprenol beta-1,3-glucosyltransferase WfgD [Aquisphaera giovannonii]|uniref:UDP-Glc:alpha-D-GlcNAc-diphosphoundecaprenol beta-1,3-glucosyltransferase WfgD n=1 Tax=Aquisphaera giovannonii TaxID=406548 RepID=A0A5B9VYF7_9BACT|nr:glycosyltransferase [Aquisphaera giovannonii]QEH33014.1 UDP-Glc:alpha-D-GlcNAc-diphosphoundecaprenol beta-1,3-glucosyltransferase WfgD [Aquisphaera giovannonii]
MRTVDSCPYRRPVADGTTRCDLLARIAGLGDSPLTRVEVDACRACCAAPAPSLTRLNPVVGSLLDRLAGRLVEAGGESGCDPERALALGRWARRHLKPLARKPGAPLIAPGRRLFPTVAVIITCHNYGRYLGEAIRSVLDQTILPAEILVVDDASDDDTAEVARGHADSGVGYLRVDHRSAYRSRKAGMLATQSKVLCFLDADDVLPHDYLERGLPLFESPEVGIVYSDVELFGDLSRKQAMPEWDPVEFDRENFMHAGSLVRRMALEIADAFREPDLFEAHEDWMVWRRVVAAGWIGSKQSALYRYRRHASEGPSRSLLQPRNYFDNGSLRLIDVTLFTALSGRSSLWPSYRDWLETQAWPREQTRLFLMDTSQDPAFAASVRSYLAASRYADVRYVARAVSEPGLADLPRGPNSAAVRLACARIYNQMARDVTTPFVLVVEDDILPPPGVIERLLRAFDRETAAVGAPYRSRGLGHYVAWDDEGEHLPGGEGVAAIGGCGFGCLLIRTSVLRDATFSYGYAEPIDFDPAFCRRLRRDGWTIKMDWSQECAHRSVS